MIGENIGSDYYKKQLHEEAKIALEKAKAINRKVIYLKQGQSFNDWREKVKEKAKTIGPKIYTIKIREYESKSGKRYYIQKFISRNINGKVVKKTFSATFKSRAEAEANIPVIQEQIREYIESIL